MSRHSSSAAGRSFRFRPGLESFECRTVPAAGFRPIPEDSVAVSPDDGGVPRVKIIDPVTGEDVGEVQAYEDSFRGGVRVALGDVTGDGVKDLVVVPGAGGGPRVKVIDGKSGDTIADFFVYEPTFTGGLTVAAGDVNGDGRDDIITGTGVGGGPRVRVLDGATLGRVVLRDYFAYEDSFRGGVLVAAGDVNGDGKDDIITGTGVGGGPRVQVFSGTDNAVLMNYFAYEDSFRGGVLVASGDIDGDGNDDVIAGTGPGGGPRVRVVSGRDRHDLLDFLADDSAFRGGVGVDSDDVNGDGRDDVISHTRRGGVVALRVFDGRDGTRIRDLNRTVDDNPSTSDIAEGGSGGGSSSGSGGSGSGSGSSGSGSSGSGNGNNNNTKLEGSVTTVDAAAGTVTIRTASGTTTVKTNAGTKIERNDAHVALSAFRVGDRGEAVIGNDGFALKLEATGS